MTITKWKLEPNTVVDKDGKVLDMGLETAQEKYDAGLAYVQRLKDEGMKAEVIKNDGNYLYIEIDG